MKTQNIKSQTVRFPEIKPLVKGVRPEDLTIHVEPLDASALYREVVWASGTAVYDEKRPNQAGIVTERVYRTVQTAEGHKLEAPNGGKRPSHLSGFFLRHLAQVENPCKRIVVWQQIAWYETQEGQRPLESGRRLGTEIRIDVYLAPKTGIERLLAETDVSKNVRLTTPLVDSMMIEVGMDTHRTGSFADADKMEKAVKRLSSIAKTFEFGAYFHGLREVLKMSKRSGMAGEIDGFSIRTKTEGRHTKIVIEKGDVTVEFEGDVNIDDPGFNISNSGFTLDEAETLTTEFVRAWKKLYKPFPQPAMLGVLRPTDNAPMA